MPAEAAPAARVLPYKAAIIYDNTGMPCAYPFLFPVRRIKIIMHLFKKIIPPGGGIMHSQLVLVISFGLHLNKM